MKWDKVVEQVADKVGMPTKTLTMPILITIITVILTLTIVTNEIEKKHHDPIWLWEVEK